MAEVRHINSASKAAAKISAANASAVELDTLPLFTFFENDDSWHSDWRIWVAIILLALLAHVLFMATHIDWTTAIRPAPVELKTIDPKKLDEIRNKWRNNQQKQLLIDTEKNSPSAKEASDKAKFMSDRNIVVQKEQRAKQTDVMPKAGAPGAATAESSEQKKRTSPHNVPKSAQPKKATQSDIPLLKNLGIPLNLSAKTRPEEEEQAPPQNSPNQANPSRSGGGGANQWVDDQTMPEGSENMLNTQESVYYSFYARLYEAIAPVWSSKVQEAAYAARVQAGDYTTVVDVVLNKEGDLVDVRQLKSSSVREFDSVVEPSWRKIGRFPNPPSGLLGSDGNLHMAWSFTMRVGDGGVSFLPPSRAN